MASTPAGSSTTRDKKKKSVNSSMPVCSVDPNSGIIYRSHAERLEGHHRDQLNESKAIQKQKKQTKVRIGRSSPPKNSSEKKEYVKPTGTGHEASGAGDGGDGKRDDKKDHGGGGGGGDGDGDGHGRDKKKDEVYCDKCKFFFDPKDFQKHDCKKVHSSTNIDG